MLLQFALYQTLACHLCEVAEAMLLPVVEATGIEIELIDIADDDQLIEQYGVRIPVLKHLESGRELGWPFDEIQLKDYLLACCMEN